MRLTRFDGPNVFTWKVLRDEPSPHYKPGEINHLKVRVEKDKFICFVNDKRVYESSDKVYQNGSIGLCRFRDTKATFTSFRVAKKLTLTQLSNEAREKLNNSIDALPKLEDFAESDIESLVASPASTSKLIAEKAKQLEQRAQELRRYADDVHRRAIAQAIAKSVKGKDEQIDLLKVCLLIAHLDDREIDVDGYQKQFVRMVNEVKKRFKKGISEADKLKQLGAYLFKEQGFHGSRFDYYHRANSYMNRVIDDREGLPITLSVLYMEFARQLGMNVEGVGLPGHFIVRFQPNKGEAQLVDVFNGGKYLSRDDVKKLVWTRAQTLLKDEHLEKSSRRAILTRVLRNLIGVAQNEGAKERLLGYLEAYMVLEPEAVAERGLRAMTRFETGRRQAAIRDLDWFIEKEPAGLDLNKIQQLRNFFQYRDPPKPRK